MVKYLPKSYYLGEKQTFPKLRLSPGQFQGAPTHEDITEF